MECDIFTLSDANNLGHTVEANRLRKHPTHSNSKDIVTYYKQVLSLLWKRISLR